MTRLKLLDYNRIDIVIDDALVLCCELQRTGYKELKIHSTILSQELIHFIFSKKSISSNFVKQFNFILDSWEKKGRLSAYYADVLPKECF